MALFDWLFPRGGYGIDELARRLGMTVGELRAVTPRYRTFSIPKRSGGARTIQAPEPELKALQRRILRRLLGRLRVHPNATGFEPGYSVVSNAAVHVGKAVVLRMDIRDFFTNTSAKRVEQYFRGLGWGKAAARLLTTLCTHKDGLPQGAPTSPRLSNLVNYRMDARLAGLAQSVGAVYSRYADDMTFSFAEDDAEAVRRTIRLVKDAVAVEGYTLHQDKKLRIARAYERQVVTGLVVNRKVNLPRATRRWLRAVEHRAATGRDTTLGADRLAGWRAYRDMIERQRDLDGPHHAEGGRP